MNPHKSAPASHVHRLAATLGTDNATLVVAGKRAVTFIEVYNGNAAVRFLKLYDKATAPASTDTPVLVIRLGATTLVTRAIPEGIYFGNGIGYRLVTDTGDSGATAVGTDIEHLQIAHRAVS